VYVAPIEVGTIERAGLLDSDGLARTLSAIEAVARSRDADFADLHDLLPGDGFRDAPGHLAWQGEVDGPARLADALAPLIASLVATPTADDGS
jgi:hypothetical protein